MLFPARLAPDWNSIHAVAWLLLGLAGCGPTAATPTTPIDASTTAPKVLDSNAARPDKGPSASHLIGARAGSRSSVPPSPPTPQEPSPFRFEEVARAAGIDFVQVSGMTEARHFPTANGSGVAIFDYDNDGKLDLYFATGNRLPLAKAPASNRLYKNLGDGQFRDMTSASGLGFAGFCHGIVVGDVDNDGDPDVFLANLGPNVLYRNNGNGTFTDVSHDAGIDRPSWSSGGAFLDYDNDGDLDLYVANYGAWKLPDDDTFCGDSERKIRLYCSPNSIRTVKHFLYRNNGDNTFTDVADEAGVGRDDGRGFGVVTADLNGDGKVDIYVANDMCPNFLFLNKGDGTFEDATELSGAAYNGAGEVQSGMGVDAEDVDGDGKPDLFVTNFAGEYNTLYINQGPGLFSDQTSLFGLAAESMSWVGWGCALADFDNDGWPDAFVADGHVDDNRNLIGETVEYAEPPLLHRNLEGKRFRLSTRDVGPYFNSKHVARGAAFGDLDDDGEIDIVVNHKDGPPAVLMNRTPTENRWIRLQLIGTRSNRDAIGARVEVEAGGRTFQRQRKGGTSMESSHDPRLLIGLGPATEAKVTVRWPSGSVSVLVHLKTNQTYEIVEEKVGP